jgi:5-methylcytosine-specific restriction enzyme subunit McrC
MAILFENFVRNFYRVETDFQVRREDIYWRWIAADQVAAGLLPKMQTDISLNSSTRKIIIDCKFTPEATQQHYEAETLRSAHLYQINAYMDNLPEDKLTDTCQKGHKISIRTINLNQPWQSIHQDLLALVE